MKRVKGKQQTIRSFFQAKRYVEVYVLAIAYPIIKFNLNWYVELSGYLSS